MTNPVGSTAGGGGRPCAPGTVAPVTKGVERDDGAGGRPERLESVAPVTKPVELEHHEIGTVEEGRTALWLPAVSGERRGPSSAHCERPPPAHCVNALVSGL